MDKRDGVQIETLSDPWVSHQRIRYEEEMQRLRLSFEEQASDLAAGVQVVEARSAAVDAIIQAAWARVCQSQEGLSRGVSLVAVGGYGRRELFPQSDVDLLLLLEGREREEAVRESAAQLNQRMWDVGLRVAAIVRTLAECERFEPENVEFTLSLLDARLVTGDGELFNRLQEKKLPRLLAREHRAILRRLLEVTRTRHAKYGETLFHLEPNVKESLGGLRDAHVCRWLGQVEDGFTEEESESASPTRDFAEGYEFLTLVRCFLHFRSGRDNNILDWQTQDAAAESSLGTGRTVGSQGVDPAYWMRLFFRHARALERRLARLLDLAEPPAKLPGRLSSLAAFVRPGLTNAQSGFELRNQRISFAPEATTEAGQRAHDPDAVLGIFALIAATGARLSARTERQLEQALPRLAANIEDGPKLWQQLQEILLGNFAGQALRSMHALGILELLLPEFHGIDALVIRDAYHRYTVDEHTFVVIDQLHALRQPEIAASVQESGLEPWAGRFGGLFRGLPHPGLLFLAALLHDTGKGHAAAGHPLESARMAGSVLTRLELDSYESGLVLELIRNHLEMSAALRRDVFHQETIRSFAKYVPHAEALRMLSLFTYADIAAVHPDALTPWKAGHLWRLYLATTHFLDRSVDEERVSADASSEVRKALFRIHALLPDQAAEVDRFLDGFPRRYLQTRSPETIVLHARMARRLNQEGVELEFHWAPEVSELTLVTTDRPRLFATVAGALAGWAMNIVTADAFSNAHGVVVDTFRFTDTFRTLELNTSERERFVTSVKNIIMGTADLEILLAGRKSGKRPEPKVNVQTRVSFDDAASSHSTLLEVVAQDTPGLLRTLTQTLTLHTCNVEVALIDTEGEMAIDVFYLTRLGDKLGSEEKEALRLALVEAVEQNAR